MNEWLCVPAASRTVSVGLCRESGLWRRRRSGAAESLLFTQVLSRGLCLRASSLSRAHAQARQIAQGRINKQLMHINSSPHTTQGTAFELRPQNSLAGMCFSSRLHVLG